jgi:Uma2 family endonuclease
MRGIPVSEVAVESFTLNDIDRLEDRDGLRYELWDGQAFAMTGGSSAHNLIALGLRDVLKAQLPRRCKVYVADMALRFSRDSKSNQAYPDVMMVCDAERGHYQQKPVLLAEVLSESSVSRDRKRKPKAYLALESVEVYLILSQTAVEIEIYRRANGWAEEVHRGAAAVIELAQPALRIPLRQVYDEVWEDLV